MFRSITEKILRKIAPKTLLQQQHIIPKVIDDRPKRRYRKRKRHISSGSETITASESGGLFSDGEKNSIASELLNGNSDKAIVNSLTKTEIVQLLHSLVNAVKDFHLQSWNDIWSRTLKIEKPVEAEDPLALEPESNPEQPKIPEERPEPQVVTLSSEDEGNPVNSDDPADCDFIIGNEELKEKLRKKRGPRPRLSKPKVIDYKCQFCPETFPKKPDLIYHIDTVHKEKEVFSCDHCSQRFTAIDVFRKHMRNLHPDEETKPISPNAPCKICNKKFFSEGGVIRHMKGVHEREKNFTCDLCGLSFFQRQGLKNNTISAHGSVRAYKCEKCPRAFKHTTALRRHVRDIHDGVKEHQCHLCGKEFAQAGNMRLHLRKHHSIS